MSPPIRTAREPGRGQPAATMLLPGFDRSAWELLPAASPLQGPAWLDAMTSKLPGEVHTVVHPGGVGFVATVVDDPEAHEAFNPWAIMFREEPVFEADAPAERRPPLPGADPAAILPALVLAAPGYVGDPAGPGGDDRELLRACLADVAEWCARRGLKALCCLYTEHAAAAVSDAVDDLGGCSFPLTARWRLPVWWDGWDGYLAGFGASRRAKIRRELRAAARAGVRPGRIDPPEHLDALVEGRCAKLASYGHAPEPAAERRRIERLLATFPGSLRGYGALRGGDLVGAVLCVEHERALHVVYAGTTAQGVDLPFTHFVASYYAVAQHVSRRDVDGIDYGIGHGTAKAFRGCRPHGLHGHAVGLDPGAAALLAAGAHRLSEQRTAPAAVGGPS